LDDLTDETEGENAGQSSEKRILELQEELENLRNQFSEYRLAVQKSMGEQLNGADDSINDKVVGVPGKGKIEQIDADYFTSYSFNGSLVQYGSFHSFKRKY
jgi:type I protein arginine methyltransferase